MTTVATPDRINRMNTTLVMRTEQPARADAMAALSLPSRRGDSLHAPQRPISMASNPRMHASTGSELKPVDHSSPINNARFCRKEGAPEMMTKPNTHKTPHQAAKEQAEAKNADVLRVLATAKKAMTPSEIAWAIERGGSTWAVRPKDGFAQGVADTSLIGAVLRRIKAVKVGRGLWLKPGANVKG